MKASILFYKPFIIPYGTKVTVSGDGVATQEAFFAGYRIWEGVIMHNHYLYPQFKRPNKDGEMGRRNSEFSPRYYDDTAEMTIPPESVEKILLRGVIEEFDIFVPHTGTLHKYVGPVCYTENGENRMIEDLSVRYETGKDPVLSVSINRTGPNIEASVRDLPQDVQERLIEALYDAGKGKKQNESEFKKIIYTQS